MSNDPDGLLEEMNMTFAQLREFVEAAVDVLAAYDVGMNVQTLIKRIETLREMMR